MELEDAQARFLEAVRSLGVRGHAETLAKMAVSLGLSEVDDEDDAIETTEHDEGTKKAEAVLPPPLPINSFQHPDAHPGVLDILLLRKYGPEWMLWEPETLQFRIPQDFRTNDVSDLNMAKIQAMKTLHCVDTPWQQWEVFVWCAQPLNGLFPDFETMQVPTVSSCLVAIDIFNLVRTDVLWSTELKAYLATVWRHEGMFVPTAPALFVDVDRTGTELDYAKIQQMWPTVRKDGRAPTEDTAEAEQLRRMLASHLHLEEAREAFDRQLKVVIGV